MVKKWALPGSWSSISSLAVPSESSRASAGIDATRRDRISLEAISEMPQQDADASEAHEAEDVFRMALMARDEPAVVL